VTEITLGAIEVLAKRPKALVPKLTLVGMVVTSKTVPTFCVGMPTKMPVWLSVEVTFGIVKFVAVLTFPVGAAMAGKKVVKPWALVIVVAWPTAAAGDRQIASADSSEVRIKSRLIFMIHVPDGRLSPSGPGERCVST
jgi:hypothetical protein